MAELISAFSPQQICKGKEYSPLVVVTKCGQNVPGLALASTSHLWQAFTRERGRWTLYNKLFSTRERGGCKLYKKLFYKNLVGIMQ